MGGGGMRPPWAALDCPASRPGPARGRRCRRRPGGARGVRPARRQSRQPLSPSDGCANRSPDRPPRAAPERPRLHKGVDRPRSRSWRSSPPGCRTARSHDACSCRHGPSITTLGLLGKLGVARRADAAAAAGALGIELQSGQASSPDWAFRTDAPDPAHRHLCHGRGGRADGLDHGSENPVTKFMDVHNGFFGVTAEQLRRSPPPRPGDRAAGGRELRASLAGSRGGQGLLPRDRPSREAVMRVHERAGHPRPRSTS